VLHFLQKFPAIENGQEHIENDEVREAGAQVVESLLAVFQRDDAVAGLQEDGRQPLASSGVVFDDEDDWSSV